MNRQIQAQRVQRRLIPYRKVALVMLLAAVVTLTGCLTPYPDEPDPEQVRLRSEIGNLGQNVERLQHRLDAVQEEQERLVRELAELRRLGREQDALLDRTRSQMDDRFQEHEKARTADRQFMVDEVSRRLAEHLTRTSASAAPATQQAHPERGRYHEVRPGETLSEIAKAYNVQVNVIARANDIENPDRLRVGQRLFIPD